MPRQRLPMAVALAAVALACAAPAQAADRLIPGDAKGPLARFKGQEWFKPLTYCSAVYAEETSLLKAAGDTAKAAEAREAGAGFLMDAAKRVEADRGVSFDEGLKTAGGQARVWRFTVMGFGGQPGFFTEEHAKCAEILKAHARSGG